MKVTKNFPWFETVAFLLILLFAMAAHRVPHDSATIADRSATQALE